MPKIHNKYKKILNIARIYTSAMLKCIRAWGKRKIVSNHAAFV